MQGISCVKAEIHNVLTLLRLTSRSKNNSYYTVRSSESERVFIKEYDPHFFLHTQQLQLFPYHTHQEKTENLLKHSLQSPSNPRHFATHAYRPRINFVTHFPAPCARVTQT